MIDIRSDSRFNGIIPFSKKIWLSSPTMHGEEQKYVEEAFRTNWVSTLGENINEIERQIAELLGVKHAVALSSGTAALHLAIRRCGEKLYGLPHIGHGTLEGKRVFCSDMTFSATVNPVAYEGGEAIFVDTEKETWNMSPEALEKAFEMYPDVKLIVLAHLYGTPAKIDEIKSIVAKHNALIVEDAAESVGATYKTSDGWKQTGSFGDIGVISFNGNKVITGSSGGMVLCQEVEDANKIRKWSTQSCEAAPWYQHEEIGFNYRMSNLIAGVIRGQLPYLKEHLKQKKLIYARYKEGLKNLPLRLNPFDEEKSSPNFWLSCAIIEPEGMCETVQGEQEYLYKTEKGKSCPQEILDALISFNAWGRPIWKPMHLQPIYRENPFITVKGNGRGQTNAYIESEVVDVGKDIFKRGLCFPSDNKMSTEEQDKIIEIIKRCFE